MRRKRPTKQAKRYYSPAERKGKSFKPPKPYRSWLEADVAQDLDEQGVPFEYETEKVIWHEPAKTRSYTPDIKLPNDIIVEVKGRWTAHDRRKMGFVLEQNPDKDIRMLFAVNNKLSRESKTRYSDWCERRGIKYAVGTKVPIEWIKEKRK